MEDTKTETADATWFLRSNVLEGYTGNFIEWTHGQSQENDKKRRKLKQEVGTKHPDLPMIDFKEGRNGKEISDIIVISEHSDIYMQEFCRLYKPQLSEQPTCSIPGGYKINWTRRGTNAVAMSVYTNKLMVQIGSAGSFIDWLNDFELIKLGLAPAKTPEKVKHSTEKVKHSTIRKTSAHVEETIQDDPEKKNIAMEIPEPFEEEAAMEKEDAEIEFVKKTVEEEPIKNTFVKKPITTDKDEMNDLALKMEEKEIILESVQKANFEERLEATIGSAHEMILKDVDIQSGEGHCAHNKPK